MHSCHTTKRRASRSANPRESADYDWGTRDQPSTLTATSQHWLSSRLEFPESGQRRRQPFSCNTTPGPILVWKPWSTLPILGGLSYHTHRIVQVWPLLTSICSGRWRMDCVDNIFLATTPSYKLWNSGPPPLVQIFTGAACRHLFIAGESKLPVVVTMSKNIVL